MGCYVATMNESGDLMNNDLGSGDLGSGQRVFTVGSNAARVEFADGCELTLQ